MTHARVLELLLQQAAMTPEQEDAELLRVIAEIQERLAAVERHLDLLARYMDRAQTSIRVPSKGAV